MYSFIRFLFPPRLLACLLACCGLLTTQVWASALQVDVVDASGRVLPSWQQGGRIYVAGEPGTRYAIRVRNTTARRLLAVVSVDGVNVLSGETAAHAQRGYVFEPWTTAEIDGWRKSLREAAAFYFTELPDSYAARMGRPANVGVIGLAVFEEWQPPPRDVLYYRSERDDAAESKSSERAAADALGAARQAAPAAAPRLGTGHGERLDSRVTTTDFRRASATPDEVIAIEYDRRSSLIARGIVPPPVVAEPDPFPQSFVPDPGA